MDRVSDVSDYTGRNGFLELGSTSIKFYVVAASGETAGEVEQERKIPWDLGYDVFEHGRISPRTISHCLTVLRGLREEFAEVPFGLVTAVGTSALREAQNADRFLRILLEELGIRIHVIEGGIEAFLLETGFRAMVESYPTALFDLGGGSNEVIEYLSAESTRKTSVPMGAIRLHCQLRRTRDLYEYVRDGRAIVDRLIHEYLVGDLPSYPELIGTGGTVRAIVKCVGKDWFDVNDVQELIQGEIHGPVRPDLDPHRRTLLLAGLLAVEGLFFALGVERVVYRTASVKSGLISFSRMMPSAGPS